MSSLTSGTTIKVKQKLLAESRQAGVSTTIEVIATLRKERSKVNKQMARHYVNRARNGCKVKQQKLLAALQVLGYDVAQLIEQSDKPITGIYNDKPNSKARFMTGGNYRKL